LIVRSIARRPNSWKTVRHAAVPPVIFAPQSAQRSLDKPPIPVFACCANVRAAIARKKTIAEYAHTAPALAATPSMPPVRAKKSIA
jgi:hypothetical protein